jgi:tetratricopeptide (TPR) repeat protein
MVRDSTSQRLSGRSDQLLRSRARFAAELGNVRAVLRWSLDRAGAAPDADRAQIGIDMCADLHYLWLGAGLRTEERDWLEQAVELGRLRESTGSARCTCLYAVALLHAGELGRAYDVGQEAVAIARRIGDRETLLFAVDKLGIIATECGERSVARTAFEEALGIAKTVSENAQADVLWNLAILEDAEGDLERGLELCYRVLDIKTRLCDEYGVLLMRSNIADYLRELGRYADAHMQIRALLPQFIELAEPRFLLGIAEQYAAVLGGIGALEQVPLVVSAAEQLRDRIGEGREAAWEVTFGKAFAQARAVLPDDVWSEQTARGQEMTLPQALAEAMKRTENWHPSADAPPLT